MNKKFWSRVICAFVGMILAATLLPGKVQAAGESQHGLSLAQYYIYAQGVAITVEDGEQEGYTKIKTPGGYVNFAEEKFSNGTHVYQVNSDYPYEADLTLVEIYGGWYSGGSGNTSVTVNGGNFYAVAGGSFFGKMTGNSTVVVNGGSVSKVFGDSNREPMAGNASVTINGGSVNKIGQNAGVTGTLSIYNPNGVAMDMGLDAVTNFAGVVDGKWVFRGDADKALNGKTLSFADGLTVSAQGLTYNGQFQLPQMTVKYGKGTLTEGTDYTLEYTAQKNAGTYSVKVKAVESGNFTGETEKQWSIEPADINNAEATGLCVEYNGRLQGDDQVVLHYGGATLEKNVDYWFYQGSSGTAVGSYKQVVRGKGNFTGSKEVTVEIIPKKLTVVEVRVEDKGYDGTTTGKILEVVLDGLGTGSVEVDYAASTAEFATPEVGQNKTVTGTIYLTGTNAPNYAAPLSYTTTGNIFNDFYAQQGKEYTVNTNDWTNGNFEVRAAEGFTVSTLPDGTFGQSLAVGEEGEGEFTFYVKRLSDGRISNPVKETYKIDKTAPTGGITIGERSWTGFFAAVYDELTNQDLDMKVTAADEMSGVEEIAYIESETALTVEELAAKSGWTTGDVVTIKAEDGKNVIYYARVTDKAGNVTYLASNGTSFDTQAPKILGVEDGGVYYGSVEVSVDDTPGAFLRKGGGVVRHPYLLSGEEVGAHMFQSEDKAGNIQRVEFEIRAVSTLEEELKDITPENVKPGDADVIEQVLQAQPGNAATEAEKAALKDVKEKAEKLLDALEEKMAATTPATGDLLLPIAGAVCVIALVGMLAVLLLKKKQKN